MSDRQAAPVSLVDSYTETMKIDLRMYEEIHTNIYELGMLKDDNYYLMCYRTDVWFEFTAAEGAAYGRAVYCFA